MTTWRAYVRYVVYVTSAIPEAEERSQIFSTLFLSTSALVMCAGDLLRGLVDRKAAGLVLWNAHRSHQQEVGIKVPCQLQLGLMGEHVKGVCG